MAARPDYLLRNSIRLRKMASSRPASRKRLVSNLSMGNALNPYAPGSSGIWEIWPLRKHNDMLVTFRARKRVHKNMKAIHKRTYSLPLDLVIYNQEVQSSSKRSAMFTLPFACVVSFASKYSAKFNWFARGVAVVGPWSYMSYCTTYDSLRNLIANPSSETGQKLISWLKEEHPYHGLLFAELQPLPEGSTLERIGDHSIYDRVLDSYPEADKIKGGVTNTKLSHLKSSASPQDSLAEMTVRQRTRYEVGHVHC
eukprot:g54022.t1